MDSFQRVAMGDKIERQAEGVGRITAPYKYSAQTAEGRSPLKHELLFNAIKRLEEVDAAIEDIMSAINNSDAKAQNDCALKVPPSLNSVLAGSPEYINNKINLILDKLEEVSQLLF